MNPLHYRILDISYRHNLSHIGSCISSVDIIDEIYSKRKEDEPFLLGNGHAGLALYVVLEKYYGFNPEKILAKHGIHATKDKDFKIWGSGGSLGQLETIAVGMALADRTKNVYLLSSDGGMQEGASWEALWMKSDLKLSNLKWIVSANGLAAYRTIDQDKLSCTIKSISQDIDIKYTHFHNIPFLKGLSAHYYKMTKEDWKWAEENK